MRNIRNKKGAIELSMSTIVVLVLAMSMLILGLVLVRTIFTTATNVMKMTDQQLKAQVGKIFTDETIKLSIYPDSRTMEIKGGTKDQIGIVIKNIIEGVSEQTKFQYDVTVEDPTYLKKCGITNAVAMSYIVAGAAAANIPIAPGDLNVQRVTFNIPVGSPLCLIRYRVTVKAGNQAYSVDSFDIVIKAK